MEEEYGRRMEKLDYRSVQTEVSGATQEYKVFTYQVEGILARAALSVSFVLVVAESRRAVNVNTSPAGCYDHLQYNTSTTRPWTSVGYFTMAPGRAGSVVARERL